MIMMGSDRKKTVNQILGDPKEEKGDESPSDSFSACMQEFIDAVHAKDVEGAKAAFRSCIADLHSEE